ncbi:hypothetical protein BB561_005728 [Smittium simulii]|uniref:Uncharacterized protein n=1 Tax=Smittium simulii TaxID=133385 RepID=A0A2T9Y8T2_9FUNG|nr:hypothetical protein BB561_005728 [Smittium simulii]
MTVDLSWSNYSDGKKDMGSLFKKNTETKNGIYPNLCETSRCSFESIGSNIIEIIKSNVQKTKKKSLTYTA